MSLLKNALQKLAVIGKEKHDALEEIARPQGLHFWKDLPEKAVEQLVKECEDAETEVLARNLSYPVQMTYDFDDDFEPRYTALTLKGIRKKGDIYTYRATCAETDFTYNFSSICIASMSEGRSESPVSDHAVFTQKFAFSLLPGYTKILHSLHVLLYIGLADGRVCDNEADIIRHYIHTTIKTEHNQYLPDILDYALNCNVEYPIFADALKTLEAEYSEEELSNFFACLKNLVESDKQITTEERQFLTSMGDKLGVWV